MNDPASVPVVPVAGAYHERVPAPTTAAAVAAELRGRLPGLKTVQLQKLLYYCQGHYVQTHEEPLFSDSIMAYDMGPIVATLWHAEKQDRVAEFAAPAELSADALATINLVVSLYGSMTGRALIDRTHRESPWLRADARRAPKGSERIEIEWIKDWFRGLLEPMSQTTRALLDGARTRATADPRVDDVGALKARLRTGG